MTTVFFMYSRTSNLVAIKTRGFAAREFPGGNKMAAPAPKSTPSRIPPATQASYKMALFSRPFIKHFQPAFYVTNSLFDHLDCS